MEEQLDKKLLQMTDVYNRRAWQADKYMKSLSTYESGFMPQESQKYMEMHRRKWEVLDGEYEKLKDKKNKLLEHFCTQDMELAFQWWKKNYADLYSPECRTDKFLHDKFIENYCKR